MYSFLSSYLEVLECGVHVVVLVVQLVRLRHVGLETDLELE